MSGYEEKFRKICDFYALVHKLKDLVRTGWVMWKVDSKRLESVAEHIYGTQMLAFAMNSEFELGMDIEKVAFMLAFHELGETLVGDISAISGVSKERKHQLEMDAVEKIVETMIDKKRVLDIFNEFENNETKEAKFAHHIDKLECDMQCKFHEEMGETNFSNKLDGKREEIRQARIKAGDRTLAQAWINWDIEHAGFDFLFIQAAEFIKNNEVFVKKEKEKPLFINDKEKRRD